jgi:hypothetical protein
MDSQLMFELMTQNYQKLGSILSPLTSETQDCIASFAVAMNDFKLFKLVPKHHPRVLMDGLSGNDTFFPRLIEWYISTKYLLGDYDLPSYVLLGLSENNAKYLKKIGYSPRMNELRDVSGTIREIFTSKM